MTIFDWAIWLERKYSDDYLGLVEVGYFTKSSIEGWFSKLYYSCFTGWSQVLFYSPNPQTDIVILRIDYYPSAIEAICDNSIFPSDLTIYMR